MPEENREKSWQDAWSQSCSIRYILSYKDKNMSEENKPMEIGEDWFCYGANFDCDKPYIILCHKDSGEEKKYQCLNSWLIT